MKCVVIGAGVFGTTAAAELRRRGHEVLIVSPGLEPDPQASSTDVSKILRMEYGPDEVYARLMVAAFEGWRELRRRWQRIDGEPIIHWPGFLLLRGEAPGPEDWESQSLEVAATLGLPHRRLDGESLARQFPAWAGAGWPFATFQPMAGYGESARIVSRLLREALVAGVKHVDDRVVELEPGEPVCCMRLASGRRIEGDIVVLAAGAWTPTLVPELVEDLQPVAQPVFRLRPSDPERFTAERFPVFAADITRTGFYGFPLDRDGLVKIANHGPGLAVPAGQSAGPGAEEEARLREFLRRRLPELASAELVHARHCWYSDTLDGHLWMDHHPERPGLVIAGGGSGHAFKFAPLLGGLVADLVEGRARPEHALFLHRKLQDRQGWEAARWSGDD